jgi:hypothetical protein
MTTDLIAAGAALPAHLQSAVGNTEAAKEFAGGVQSGFPVISYRGGTWRVRQGGEEQVYVDTEGDAIQSIRTVMIQSNERPSKTYYEGKYTEGDSSKPQCWSANGVTPDADVPNPVNAACASCPMNVWGSKITEQGNKTRACQDVRRCAVTFEHELEAAATGQKPVDELPVMLLRIPPASLNPLKDYAVKVLGPKGLPVYVLITKVGFDTAVSYPKLTFKGERFLSEAEFGIVEGLRDSDMVRRILDTSAEHVTEGTPASGGDAATSNAQANAEAPAPAPSEASQPNTEEQHFSEPVPEPAPAPVVAAPPPVVAAPPPVVAAPPPVVAAPAPEPVRAAAVEEHAAAAPVQPPKPQATAVAAPSPVPAPIAESPGDDADIEDMLSSILD